MKMLKIKILLGVVAFFCFIILIVSFFVGISNIMTTFLGKSESMQSGQEINMEVSPVAMEVLQYRDRILEEAKLHGIEEYIDLLLAIVMQESGGRYDDIFQSSESLGLEQNTLNTEESIKQGVKVMAERLQASGCEGINDILRIRLALQSYNFGAGYIAWGLEHSGGWSQESTYSYAEKYSDGKRRTGKEAEQLGQWAYGDQYYTQHVLRYYRLESTRTEMGEMPIFNQNDYYNSYGDGTIASSGCGLVSFAMVVSYLKDEYITPVQILEWSGNRYYQNGVGTYWSFFKAASIEFEIGEVIQTSNSNSVIEALKRGQPVISSQSAGIFTNGGHFIVLRGITENEEILVNDPDEQSWKGHNTRKFDFLTEIDVTSAQYWIFPRKE
jgi:hypothetical protein